jgi:circadian clock protein KaiC
MHDGKRNASPGRSRVVSSGVPGLDEVLGGGLTEHRLYVLEGKPGTGKTTLALQFLLEGLRNGESVLYVTLSETAVELTEVARSHGWTLPPDILFELTPPDNGFGDASEQTLLHPSEVELGETTRAIIDRVEATRPARVVFDSMSEMRLLARSSLSYRRQVLALKHYFAQQRCTVLLLDDLTSEQRDQQMHSIAHGVILLEQPAREYGIERRRLRIAKMRGISFRGGYHDFVIKKGGLAVFPRIIASEYANLDRRQTMSSGIGELDALLGGGLSCGTSTLLMGPAGSGKSTLAMHWALSAAERGDSAAIFGFDESLATALARCDGLGMDLRSAIDRGAIKWTGIDPAELAPGEFAHSIRQSVERDKCRVVIIDSLNGYLNAMPEERFLVLQMHELLTFLSHKGALTILVMAQHGMIGHMETPLDLSYLSDSILLLRYFEAEGEIRQALSVVKKRSGAHERTIREYRMGPKGLRLGPPLVEFRGVLTGVPQYIGQTKPLLGDTP